MRWSDSTNFWNWWLERGIAVAKIVVSLDISSREKWALGMVRAEPDGGHNMELARFRWAWTARIVQAFLYLPLRAVGIHLDLSEVCVCPGCWFGARKTRVLSLETESGDSDPPKESQPSQDLN